jgi:hypothetical protein
LRQRIRHAKTCSMGVSKAEFVVFYAWQSDRPGSGNRNFIQEAAVAAAERINADPSLPYTIRIDQDTQGEPGLCDIPATILKKIDAADAFLCDLTYVARTWPAARKKADANRLCSNPNVLFETGYAFRSLGPERIICVMNGRYGPAAEQIFDLAHRRFPIVYRWPDEARSRASAVGGLAAALDEAITGLLGLGPRAASGAADRVSVIRNKFETRVRNNDFHRLSRPHGAIAIAVIPASPMQLSAADFRFKTVSPPGCSAWSPAIRGNCVLSIADLKGERRSLAEMRLDGAILAAESLVLDPNRLYSPPSRQKLGLFVPSISAEKAIISSATEYLTRFRELNAPLPWTVCVSLLEVKDYWLYAFEGQTTFYKLEQTDIRPDPIIIPAVPESLDFQSVAQILKPSIDFIWREFGFEQSYHYSEGGIYDGGMSR